MKPQETFDFQIRKSWIALSKMYNEQVAQYGLTVAMGFALLNIDIKKGTPSTSLGPKMGMESTSLSRLLNSLEKQSLISRESNPDDGRSVLIIDQRRLENAQPQPSSSFGLQPPSFKGSHRG